MKAISSVFRPVSSNLNQLLLSIFVTTTVTTSTINFVINLTQSIRLKELYTISQVKNLKQVLAGELFAKFEWFSFSQFLASVSVGY